MSYFQKHVEACAKIGITPQKAPWQEGREQGLRVYCTPQNAYKIGRFGKAPTPVCTPQEAADMALASATGLEYYRLEKEIDDLKRDLDKIDADLYELAKSENDPSSAGLLSLRRFRIESKIWALEREQRKYATWP